MSGYEDTCHALYPPTGGGECYRRQANQDESYVSDLGSVSTRYGFVIAETGRTISGLEFTFLEVIKEGRKHKRWFSKRYSRRGLTTKAKQFAEEVFTEGGQQ